MNKYREKLLGISFIKVKHKENLPYGDKSRGRFVEPKDGRAGILVPSWGALEKEEIDYIVEAEQEKEDDRLKKKSTTKLRLEQVVAKTRQAPEGERAKTAQKAIREIDGYT